MPESVSRIRGVVGEITFIAPIKQGFVPGLDAPQHKPIRYADRLRLVLEAFNDREDQYDATRARRVPTGLRAFGGIQFAHLALIDGDTRLLFSVDFDGSPHDYLAGLAINVPWLLELVFSNCQGWQPVEGNPGTLIKFIEAHQVLTNFWYAHLPGATVRDREWLHALDEELDSFASAHEASRDAVARLRARVAERMAPMLHSERVLSLFQQQQRSFDAHAKPADAERVDKLAHQLGNATPAGTPQRELDPALRTIERYRFETLFERYFPEAVVVAAADESFGAPASPKQGAAR